MADRPDPAPAVAESSKPVDGGPAFPMPSGDEPRVNSTTHYNEGVSLRDWFAGQAMAAIAQKHNIQLCRVEEELRERNDHTAQRSARVAYMFADAMLAARGGAQ